MIQFVESPLTCIRLSVFHIRVEVFWPTFLCNIASLHWGFQAFVYEQSGVRSRFDCVLVIIAPLHDSVLTSHLTVEYFMFGCKVPRSCG